MKFLLMECLIFERLKNNCFIQLAGMSSTIAAIITTTD